MPNPLKREISVALDEDLIAELERGPGSLSKQVNEAVRETLRHQRRQRLLVEFLDDLDRRHGPVAEERVQAFTRLLE